MKKIYMNPTMKVVEIQCRKMLTGSDPKIGSSYSGGAILAPGRNNYDDFDEDF